jgi:hypothetical protein
MALRVGRVPSGPLSGRANFHDEQDVDTMIASTFQVAELPTGVYLYRMQTEQGPVVKRFLVEESVCRECSVRMRTYSGALPCVA